MAEIDRRTAVRGMLYFAAFAAAGSTAITAPELAKAVPLAADETGPAEPDDAPGKDDASDKDDLVGMDDVPELPERAQPVQYWYRRRRRRWWWRRRRRCWWRRGRLVCVRRW